MLFIITNLGGRYLKSWKGNTTGNCFHCFVPNYYFTFSILLLRRKKEKKKRTVKAQAFKDKSENQMLLDS